MTVSKWGLQTFFNPPESPDSGFMKASITPVSESGTSLGLDTELQIADCSRRIYLEMDPYALYTRTGKERDKYRPSDIQRAKDSIKERRKKVAVMRKSFNDTFDALERAYDEYEKDIKAIPKDKIE